LEVNHQLVLGRRLNWHVGGLFALEDAIDIVGRASVLVDDVRTVGDQAAASDGLASPIDRGQFVPGRQHDDQIAVNDPPRAPCHRQAAIRDTREGRYGALDLTGVAHVDRAYLHPDRQRHGLDGGKLADSGGAARVTAGAISFSNSSHFPLRPYSNAVNPVALPPGRARLSTNPAPTGSGTVTNTTGTTRVACSSGPSVLLPVAKITSGESVANSAAYLRVSLASPLDQRISTPTFRPSVQPSCCKPCSNAAMLV